MISNCYNFLITQINPEDTRSRGAQTLSLRAKVTPSLSPYPGGRPSTQHLGGSCVRSIHKPGLLEEEEGNTVEWVQERGNVSGLLLK